MNEPETMPIQKSHLLAREPCRVPKEVYMAAYEVYCKVCGPQEALVQGNCRGGFDSGELVAFLYARAFPKDEWREKVDAALKGMRL